MKQSLCQNPECGKPFTPPPMRPGKRYCCRQCGCQHYKMTHKEVIRERKQETTEESRAGKPLSPEFLAKWWTLVEIERQKAVQVSEERLRTAWREFAASQRQPEAATEGLEDWVETARRPKTGLKPAITCHCGRTVVPGSGFCWRHIGETK